MLTNNATGLASSPSGDRKSGSTIHFTVTGLIALCASLVGTSVAVTRFMETRHQGGKTETAAKSEVQAAPAKPATADAPWGDLITLDVEIQQPEEYVSFDTTKNHPQWIFSGLTANQVKEKLSGCGLTAAQISAALADGKVTSRSDATVVSPDASLILSLSPEARIKLYSLLATWPENKFMFEPYHLPGNFSLMAAKTGVSQKAISLIGKLTYTRAGVNFFSDPEVVLAEVTGEDERLHLLKALTYQTAVLARLKLSASSDIDKIVGYWGSVPGVRAKDLTPLLESVARTPDGGTVSLLYLLPQFARERLYTFPLPTQAGEKGMDCHWTALNFLNSEPDDRLGDPEYASAHIKEKFYQIGKPSMCGDVLFVLDPQGGVIHSAVYIADDIVFTKNGVNYAQPWILMRTKDLLNAYTKTETPKVVYYRRKDT